MPFLYQNQVFFREFLLRFPIEIEFVRTIVQNHEKVVQKVVKTRNFCVKLKAVCKKRSFMYIAQSIFQKRRFLYQNQVFFRKFPLRFPIEIEFVRTIVQYC